MTKGDNEGHLGPYLKQSNDELLQFAVLALDAIAQGMVGENPKHMAVRAILVLDDMARAKGGDLDQGRVDRADEGPSG